MKTMLGASCAALLLLVGACSGGDDEPTATPSASASASEQPAGDLDPGARPDDVETDAGLVTFAEYVTKTIVAVSGGANGDELLALTSGATCTACIEHVQSLSKSTFVQRLSGPPLVAEASVIGETEDGSRVVEQAVTVPPGQKVDKESGSVTGELGETTLTIRIAATWTDDKWVLTNYSTEKLS